MSTEHLESGSQLEKIFSTRLQDFRRHVHDLQTRTYEGSASRPEREQQFRRAFDLITPVAIKVLQDIDQWFLKSSGEVKTIAPESDDSGGLVGRWELTWPRLREARNRYDGSRLSPLSIRTIFPIVPTQGMAWTHPHLALSRDQCHEGIAAAWPLQVVSVEDAWRQEAILRVLAEAELHECTFLADINWRVLPFIEES